MTIPTVTPQEREKILNGALASREPLLLKVLPAKLAKKIVVLEEVAETIPVGTFFTETEVNALLGMVYNDPVTLRRDLVDFKFLCRTPNGASYWREVPDCE